MKTVWLGQAGLLIETNGITIIADPYLSNSVEKTEPHNYRRVAADESFLEIKPDVVLLTHSHLDHTDPETLCHYIKPEGFVTVLAPTNAYTVLREKFSAVNNNFVLFNPHTVWTEKGVKFTAVKAEHSDRTAIGIIIETECKKLYITGDTLYNTDVLKELPSDIDYVFLPVNGKGNNMNMTDAAAFCEEIGAKAIPMHCGLFDNLDMNTFPYENKVVPQFYKEIKL